MKIESNKPHFDRQLHRTMQSAFGPYTSDTLLPMPSPARSLIRPVLCYALALALGVGLFFLVSK